MQIACVYWKKQHGPSFSNRVYGFIWAYWDIVTIRFYPPFYFFSTLPFQSHDLTSHGPSPDLSPDFHHMTTIIVLTVHCSIVLPTYCSRSPLSLPHCSWPHCSPKAIVRLLRTLSQVAASGVYKLACIIERGLKPDLVFLSKCCCFHQLNCVPSSSPTSFLFGSSQSPLRLFL